MLCKETWGEECRYHKLALYPYLFDKHASSERRTACNTPTWWSNEHVSIFWSRYSSKLAYSLCSITRITFHSCCNMTGHIWHIHITHLHPNYTRNWMICKPTTVARSQPKISFIVTSIKLKCQVQTSFQNYMMPCTHELIPINIWLTAAGVYFGCNAMYPASFSTPLSSWSLTYDMFIESETE